MNKIVEFPSARVHAAAPGFYSAREAGRLARLPRQRLDAWRREGIITPTVLAIDEDGHEESGYTFEALVYLRLLRMLRDHSIALHKAVEGIQSLRERFGSPSRAWGDVRLLVQGGQVFVHRADAWEVTAATSEQRAARHQKAMPYVLFGREFEQLKERLDSLLVPDRFKASVEVDPEARSGLPVVAGTTIRTGLLYGLRMNGYSYKRIQEWYPHLTLTQIRMAVTFERFLDAEVA